MNLYEIDVRIAGTAYIKAKSKAEAVRKAKGLKHLSLQLGEDEQGELPISGRDYDDPRLPEISLSPAMTIHGPWNAAFAQIAEAGIPAPEEA